MPVKDDICNKTSAVDIAVAMLTPANTSSNHTLIFTAAQFLG